MQNAGASENSARAQEVQLPMEVSDGANKNMATKTQKPKHTTGRRSLDRLVRSHHGHTYGSLTNAVSQAQNAHYALEEGEYRSAVEYIREAETALANARKLIEPEMRT